jgi:cyclophilin family peptidyl-prolyl cis-trans isomerase/HEAT repeat protein
MRHFAAAACAILFIFSADFFAQVPIRILVQIVKAEDERRFDSTLTKLIKNPDPQIRQRAILAIGRIGQEAGIGALDEMLAGEQDEQVRAMTVFAVGEIESAKGAGTILKVLQNSNSSPQVTARAVEAAGKIAAANAKDENSKKLGAAVLEKLNFEVRKRSGSHSEVILLGLTAVLRARPEGGEPVVAEFLEYSNPRVRADALNTLARMRSKTVNSKVRELLSKDPDPIVRANAARVLGAAEDKDAVDLLLRAATKDQDSRVRVSAVRALAGLKEAGIAEKLIPPAIVTASNWSQAKVCAEDWQINRRYCDDFKSEYLEIATALGRLLPNTDNRPAVQFLETFREIDRHESPESEIAFARIAPARYVKEFDSPPNEQDAKILKADHRPASAIAQGLGELANNPDEKIRAEAKRILASLFNQYPVHVNAVPDVLTAYAAFKPDDLQRILLRHLKHRDPIVRSTTAGLLANQPASRENLAALNEAFKYAFLNDKKDNDATLAILDALFKLDKKEAVSSLFLAADSKDYLVRKKAFELMKDESYRDSGPVRATLDRFLTRKKDQVAPYSSGSKLGQVLNTNADFSRAVSRKNGRVKAVFTTSKGDFTIDLLPEDAPLAVDNFIKLANSNYFNGVSVHRVVPNFVMQDGDPRGDGNGGPGWSIRCEINTLAYGRGAVGMALSGKDTGGSQWFVTHSPQPHLDGGYTIFGQVGETDMKVVDRIVRGDKILRVRITN